MSTLSCAAPSLPSQPGRFNGLRVTSAALVIAIGLMVLIGWATGSVVLRSVVPGMTSMKVNTAIGLMLLAGALLGIDGNSESAKWWARGCLMAVLLMSVATLAEYLFGIDLHIDNALFYDDGSPRFPGRNAPATNVAFLGLVVALGLVHLGRALAVAQVLLFVAAMAPLATLGAYLYGTPGLYQNAPYPVIALHTAVALMLLCVGGLFSRPDAAMMRVLLSRSLAGSVGRKLLPAAIGLPMLTGLLVQTGERAGLFTNAFASALLVTCCILFFAAAVYWTVALLWQAEASRAEAEHEARLIDERANQAKDEFLSVISHELRTPLNAILGWSQILLADALDNQTRQGLEVIDRNARGQVRIIEDLLDISRIVRGNIKLELQAVELRTILTAAVDAARPVADAKGVALVGPTTWPAGTVRGDPGRLQQVVGNLLSNAVKFTPRGGTVTVLAGQGVGRQTVTVADTGSGIPAHFVGRLFERFHQADSGTTRRHGGLGLGLSIAKRLVELHDGTIRVESSGPGQGSTFVVSLPDGAGHAGGPPFAHDTPPASVSRQSLSGVRVLVVDDEADAREMVKQFLERSDAAVRVAASADAAFAAVLAEMPDVLVSDIGMPVEDGHGLIRRIRSLPGRAKALPAVALTAYARAIDRERALTAGFQLHLTKPVDPAHLVDAVSRLTRPT